MGLLGILLGLSLLIWLAFRNAVEPIENQTVKLPIVTVHVVMPESRRGYLQWCPWG